MKIMVLLFPLTVAAAMPAPSLLNEDIGHLSVAQAREGVKTARRVLREAQRNEKNRPMRESRRLQGIAEACQESGGLCKGFIQSGVCHGVTVTNDAEAEEAAACTHAVGGSFTIDGTFTKNFTSKLINVDHALTCKNGCAHWKFPNLVSMGYLLADDDSLVEIKNMFPVLTSIVDSARVFDGNNVGSDYIYDGEWSLYVFGANLKHIDDFHKLKAIQSIYFTEMPSLKSVRGFGELTTVGYDFSIEDCPELETIPEFPKLRVVGYEFWIGGNPKLKQVHGFNELRVAPWDMSIYENGVESIKGFNKFVGEAEDGIYLATNPNLKIIDAFNDLTYTYSKIDISHNPELIEIKGFNGEGLWSEEGIQIFNNSKLKTVNAFEGVLMMDYTLYVGDNPELTSFSGFKNALTFPTHIEFWNNSKLVKLDAFHSLTKANKITISHSPQLDSLAAFGSLLSLPDGGLTVENVGRFDSSSYLPHTSLSSDTSDTSSADSASDDAVSADDTVSDDDTDDDSDRSSAKAFKKLATVSPGLVVDQTGLQSLDTFSALRSVLGISQDEPQESRNRIAITDNADLKNIDGLSNVLSDASNDFAIPLPLPDHPRVHYKGVVLDVAGNAKLENLNGVAQLKDVYSIEIGGSAKMSQPLITKQVVQQAFQGMTAESEAHFEFMDGTCYNCHNDDVTVSTPCDINSMWSANYQNDHGCDERRSLATDAWDEI